MSKIEDFSASPAAPVKAKAGKGTVGALEGLAGFAEDVNNQSMDSLADPETLQKVVKQRFGPNVTVSDVTEALDALRDLSVPS